MHLFSNQILWDFPRFWGFCALNLFNISIGNYIYIPLCVYWHNHYKGSPFMNHLYLASLWSQHQNHQVRNIRSKLLSPPKNIGFYRRVFSNRGSQVLCKFAPRSRSERKAMKRPPLNSPNWTCAMYNGARSLSARIGHQFLFPFAVPTIPSRLTLWPILPQTGVDNVPSTTLLVPPANSNVSVSCSSLRVILAPLDFLQLRYPPPAKHVHPGEQSGWWPLHGEWLPQIHEHTP